MACEVLGIDYKYVLCDLQEGDNFKPEYLKINPQHTGAKYLVYFSTRSFKTRERFAQFVYFLREVCLLINFWHNCEFYHSKIEK